MQRMSGAPDASPRWSGRALAGVRDEPWRAGIVVLAVAIAILIAQLPPPAGVAPRAMIALGLTAGTVLLWATVAIPQPYAAMAFLLGVLATGTSGPAVAASGYSSSALLLVLGGVLVGLAAERSGLGLWIARRFFGRFRGSYPSLVAGILVGTTILAFLVPANMGRLAITVPVVMALARDVGYVPGSNGYNGLLITTVVGNFTVALAILPGNLLNMMVVGAGETLYGVHFSYLGYLYLCAPVIGLAKAVVVWLIVPRLFPAPAPAPTASAEAPPGLTPEGLRVAAILAVAIGLWASDVWHGIRPGWVALGAGLVCLTPRLGVLDPLEAVQPARLLIVFWVGTVLSLGAVLTDTGASALVSAGLTGLVAADGAPPLYGHLVIAYLASLLAALATIGGAVPITVATAGDIARATGLPPEAAVLSVTAGLSALLFPYVAAPIVVGLQMAQVSLVAAARFMVVLAVVTWLTLIPLNALWWRLAGFLP
jgi:di/tricarboxylate transporter